MNKLDLISKVAASAGLTKQDTAKAIDATLKIISSSLKSGQEVRLIGFGTFEVVNRAATTGRNPRTGEPMKIKATRLPKFRPGKQLKHAVSV